MKIIRMPIFFTLVLVGGSISRERPTGFRSFAPPHFVVVSISIWKMSSTADDCS